MEKEPNTTPEREADVEEAPEPIEGTEPEETTAEEPSQPDYEAIAKEEEDRKPDPEKAKEAFKEREKKREEIEVQVEDQPLTRDEVWNMVQESQMGITKTLQENSAVTVANSMAESEAEARAMLAKWKNRSFPAGMSLQEQMEEMHAVVNRKKFVSQNNEIKRALKSKDTVTQDAGSTHRDAPEGTAPKITSADAQGLKSAGLKWDGVKRVYYKDVGRNQRLETKGPGYPRSIVDK